MKPHIPDQNAVHVEFWRGFCMATAASVLSILSACGGGGGAGEVSGTSSVADGRVNIPPGNVKLVEVSSQVAGSLSASWLPASDDADAPGAIKYQLHASTAANFTPSADTLKFEGAGVYAANVTSGLMLGANYTVRLLAIDSSGAKTSSDPLSLTVSSINGKSVLNASVVQLNASQVTLVGSDQVTLQVGVTAPKVGQFIASSDGTGFLKQVTAVTTSSGVTVLQTRNATLDEVLSDVSMSSSFRMVSVPKEVADTAIQTGLVAVQSNTPNQVTSYAWPTTGFRYAAPTLAAVPKVNTGGLQAGLHVISADLNTNLGTWGKISAPRRVAITEEENASFKMILSINVNDIPWMGTAVGICKVELGAVRGLGNGSNPAGLSVSQGPFDVQQSEAANNRIKVAYLPINIKAAKGTANAAPYKVDATLYIDDIGDGCNGDNFGATWREKIKVTVEILVVNDVFPEVEPITREFSGVDGTSDGVAAFTVTNEIQMGYQPTVSFDQTLAGGRLQYARILVQANPTVKQTLNLNALAAGTVKKTVELIAPRKFFKVYVAGGIPIVISGVYRLNMSIVGNTTGALTATEQLYFGFDKISYGVEYKNGAFKEITEVQPVYQLSIGGKGKAEANLEISLQPSMEITAYEALTGKVLLEPYMTLHAGVDGVVQLDTDVDFNTLQTRIAADADYRLTKANLGGGVRASLYADFRIFDQVILAWPKKDQPRVLDLIAETPIISIPDISATSVFTQVHPNDTRAILVKGKTKDIANPLQKLFSSLPDAYVKWAAWTDPRIVPKLDLPAGSYKIIASPTGDPGETWVVITKPGSYTVRQGGYSSWGTWARQYVETTLDIVDANANGIPDWWEQRYRLQGTGAEIAEGDPDGDGISNLDEWLAGTDPGIQIQWEIVDLGVLPGGDSSLAYKINAEGTIVGESNDAGTPCCRRTVIWSNNSVTPQAMPYPTGSAVGFSIIPGPSINDLNQVVGNVSLVPFSAAVRWDNLVSNLLTPVSGSGASQVTSINNKGNAVGYSFVGNVGTLWIGNNGMALGSRGGSTNIPLAINNLEVIVGYSSGVDNSNAFATKWITKQPVLLGQLDGGLSSEARAINDAGIAVGYGVSGGQGRALMWTKEGIVTALQSLPGSVESAALAINSSGEIVGSIMVSGGAARPVLWRNGKPIDLFARSNALANGWTNGVARGINDSGKIVGSGTFNGQSRGFVLK
jgi:uncharacterized membrane protein